MSYLIDIFSCQGNFNNKSLQYCSKNVKKTYDKNIKGFIATAIGINDKIEIHTLNINSIFINSINRYLF